MTREWIEFNRIFKIKVSLQYLYDVYDYLNVEFNITDQEINYLQCLDESIIYDDSIHVSYDATTLKAEIKTRESGESQSPSPPTDDISTNCSFFKPIIIMLADSNNDPSDVLFILSSFYDWVYIILTNHVELIAEPREYFTCRPLPVEFMTWFFRRCNKSDYIFKVPELSLNTPGDDDEPKFVYFKS